MALNSIPTVWATLKAANNKNEMKRKFVKINYQNMIVCVYIIRLLWIVCHWLPSNGWVMKKRNDKQHKRPTKQILKNIPEMNTKQNISCQICNDVHRCAHRHTQALTWYWWEFENKIKWKCQYRLRWFTIRNTTPIDKHTRTRQSNRAKPVTYSEAYR